MNAAEKEIFKTYCPVDFEDIILSAAFADVEKGFYVDVGANDPEIRSVTKYFYDKGWNGINIEPLKEEYEMLRRERKRDINLNIGVADKKGQLEFQIDGSGTTCAQEITKIKSSRCLKKEIIQVERLEDVLDEHADLNKTIHFCKIDVEGFERNVLEGINFAKNRPVMFCIESTIPGTNTPSYRQWEDILLNNDYTLAFAYGVNRYYCDKLCDSYNSILKTFGVDAAVPDGPAGNNEKISAVKKIKRLSGRIAGAAWRLLPDRFRLKLILPLRLKLQCKRLLRRLNLNYEVTIVSK